MKNSMYYVNSHKNIFNNYCIFKKLDLGKTIALFNKKLCIKIFLSEA